jgi:hypothetical protein
MAICRRATRLMGPVAAGIVYEFCGRHHRAAGEKPCAPEEGAAGFASDAARIRAAPSRSSTLAMICPMPFARPLVSDAVAVLAYDDLPIHFCNSTSGTLRPCSGRI